MKFVILTHDVGWTSTAIQPEPLKAPDVGLELAKRFNDAMQGEPWLAAVIPTCLDDEGRKWIAEQYNIRCALHGVTHQRGEFDDDTRETMKEKLVKAMIDFPFTNHFVPPFNKVKAKMLKVLPEIGLENLWSGNSMEDPVLDEETGLLVIPCHPALYSTTKWIMDPKMIPLVKTLPKLKDEPGAGVITLHLPWEHAHDPTFSAVAEMVQFIKDDIISPDAYALALRS